MYCVLYVQYTIQYTVCTLYSTLYSKQCCTYTVCYTHSKYFNSFGWKLSGITIFWLQCPYVPLFLCPNMSMFPYYILLSRYFYAPIFLFTPFPMSPYSFGPIFLTFLCPFIHKSCYSYVSIFQWPHIMYRVHILMYQYSFSMSSHSSGPIFLIFQCPIIHIQYCDIPMCPYSYAPICIRAHNHMRPYSWVPILLSYYVPMICIYIKCKHSGRAGHATIF